MLWDMKAPLLSPFCHWSWIASSCGSKWPPCCSDRQPVPRCAMGHRKLQTPLAAEKPGDPGSWKVYQLDGVDGLSSCLSVFLMIVSFYHSYHLSFWHFPWLLHLSPARGCNSNRGLQGFFSWLSDWRLQADVGREGCPVRQWCLCLVVRKGRKVTNWPTTSGRQICSGHWLLEFRSFTVSLFCWGGVAPPFMALGNITCDCMRKVSMGADDIHVSPNV